MTNCVHFLVYYCRLLIIMHGMNNIKETFKSDIWNGKTVELHNMAVCIAILYWRACQCICLFLFIYYCFVKCRLCKNFLN
jgi:hypothetical protein